MISAKVARKIFDALFLATVGLILYSLYQPWRDEWFPSLERTLGPYATVLTIVGGTACFFGLLYVNHALWAVLVALYGAITQTTAIDLEKAQGDERTLRRIAHRYEKKGEFAQAGEVFESLQSWAEAAQAFENAGLPDRAAHAWLRAGERLKAIPLFEQVELFAEAAEACLKEGLRDRAAKNFRAAGIIEYERNNYTKAAQYFEKAMEFERAGTIYQNIGRIEDALRCYERGGATDKIEALIAGLDPQQLIMRGESCVELVKRCAELLRKQGKRIEAAELLEKAGDFVRAAEIYEEAQAWDRAGEAYFQAGLLDRAEKAYDNVADRQRVAEFFARIAIQNGDWKTAGQRFLDAGKLTQAIDAFKRAKDYLSAAKVYEESKRYLMAAEMYAAAKEIKLAGDAYAKGHDWRNAAECYEVVGELPLAIKSYASAGDYFRAGKLAVLNNEYDVAVDYLQRVPPSSPDWKLATGFLGVAFYRQGRLEMAREMFQRVTDSIVPAGETLPILYVYGCLLADEGNPEAVAVFRRILAVNANYEDVRDRINQVEEQLKQSSSRPAFSQFSQPPQPTPYPSMPGVYPTVNIGASTQTHYGFQRPITQVPETRFGEEGRYQIISELGRGGMAIVYRAFDTHLEREVALKTFPLSRHSGPGREDVFLREARLIARLSHPNIVTIYDCGHMNYLYYIAMEYVPGENLKQRVKTKGPLSLEDLKRVIVQLADALIYAHSQQVLHRDVKPANVIQRESGDIKVVDFGVAKILSDAATYAAIDEDSQRTLVGTPQYMAPEQILGLPVDARADIYALGLTIFYLVTGRTPFDVKKVTDPVEISQMQVHSSFPKPSTLRATLPQKLDEIFIRCTQKSPNDRYASVKEFLEDFLTL
jgi:tetratricopeptide (TPR) repeat protein